MVNTREYNNKRFSIFKSEEKTALELMNELGDVCNNVLDRTDKVEKDNNKKVSYDELHTKYQLTTDGTTANFNGSWQGLNKPTLSEEGAFAQVEKNMADIIEINEQLDNIETKVETLEKEVDIGCVLRPTTDLTNPWILFQDDAHESKGITSISHNSDGTIQLTFDKTYKKIKAFNAFNDEMMKIYGLEAGASTGLNTAKLFLISNLQVGISLTFNQSTGDIIINSGGGHIESVKWNSGVGAVIKFKNVPMQTPKSVQVMVSNALFLHSTCSITGNREITVKFYKPTGELVSDITGNWSCMINANFSGLVDFNAISIYDENILSSMALMYSATMKQ